MEAVLGLAALAHSCLFCQRPLDQHLAERTVRESLCTRTCSRHLQSSWRLEQPRGVAIARIACVRRQAPRAHFSAARTSDGIPRAILQHDIRPGNWHGSLKQKSSNKLAIAVMSIVGIVLGW